jgi:carboxypeptidase D
MVYRAVVLLLAALLGCTLAVETEYVAILKVPNPEDVVGLIKRGISLDHPNKQQQTFEAYVTEKDIPILKEFNVEYQIQQSQPEEHLHEKRAGTVEYHNYGALTSFMEDIATRYPSITRLFSIGKSVQSRELWGIEISDNIDKSEAEPQFQYIANMHGDEVVGREMSLYLIELLCSKYGVDDRITKLVNDTDIYIIPSMNPDGYERRQRGNANNVDLNRNFPDQFTSPSNTKTGKQPEVQAVMTFVEQHHFVLGANFHGGAVVANYPYDGNSNYRSGAYASTPDDSVYKFTASTYSNKHRTMHNSWEFSGGITNGAEWYVLYGGMQDWNYVYNQGSFHITIELSDDKWPSASSLATFWDDNREAMLSYMELVHQLGIKGIVRSTTGTPLAATITVGGNSRTVVTNPAHGDYYRLLAPGTYSITASATGYTPSTVSVTIPQGQTAQIVVDFVLTAQLH